MQLKLSGAQLYFDGLSILRKLCFQVSEGLYSIGSFQLILF